MSDTENGKAAGWTPPYIAWRNLLNLIERLESNMPPQIDRTFLTGSNQSRTQTMNALKSLELIGPDGSLTERLIGLVEAGANRPETVRKMVETFYPEPVRLGTLNATQKQLEEAFAAYGVTGSTTRKAIAFFLKAATYGKVPLSPNFKTPANPTRTRKARPTKKKDEEAEGSASTNSSSDPAGSLQARYIEMLMTKVEAQDEMDDDLLDRIENLLALRESDG